MKMKFDIDHDGMIFNVDTGEEICSIDDLDKQGEISKMIITSLIYERDCLLDEVSNLDYKIEALESDLEMYEDNWGIEE